MEKIIDIFNSYEAIDVIEQAILSFPGGPEGVANAVEAGKQKYGYLDVIGDAVEDTNTNPEQV
jgi:hypothetical protein